MRIGNVPVTSFLIPLLVLLFSFRLVVFDASFYKAEFEKYGVYGRFDKDVADPAVESLIGYMKSGYPLSDFFNEKEKVHMFDVCNIVQKVLLVFFILLSVFVVSLFSGRGYFFKSLFYGGVCSLAVILLFFLVSSVWFDFIFYKFHELSFSNDFWMLNPDVDNLKALLPDGFFYDALLRIFFISLVVSAGLVLSGFLGWKVLNIQKYSVDGK